MNKVERIYLGGTGKMYLTTLGGVEYIFKPGVDKSGYRLEPFRADVQEAGYKVQLLVDDKSAIKCFTERLVLEKGKQPIYGAFQEKIPTKDLNLKRWQYESGKISADIGSSLLREAVTDYLLANFDAHGGNFILGQDNILRGVDKEQSYRYILNCPTDINLNYSLNTLQYGEAEPILHTLLKKYAKGDIDLDLLSVFNYIDEIDKIDDSKYMAIFSKYLLSLKQTFNQSNEQTKEMFLKILERKKHLRNAFIDILIDVIGLRIRHEKSNELLVLKEEVNEKRYTR